MTAHGANLRIDGQRLWDSLTQMAKIGPGVRGGNNRQTLTDADREARLLFQQWCEAQGLRMRVDAMGSMFARREGTDPTLAPVMVGSHLDTQPTGGKYDGVLGVLAGVELVRSLNELGVKTRRPIEIVNWTNEEGARFAPAMLASGVFAGLISLEDAYALTDAEGLRFGDELARIGFKGDEPVGAVKPHAFLELHIEQGPNLEAEELDVGIVTHGQGLRWLRTRFEGRESHAGTTPMSRRADAGLGMAQAVRLVNDIALAHAPIAVGTVGLLDVAPGSPNIIPGAASLVADLRHPDLETLRQIEASYRQGVADIATRQGLGHEIEIAGQYDPVTFDAGCVAALRGAAEKLGYRHRDLISGAGHDACWINHVAPTAMVMCPCVDGLSHNEDEEITPAWAEAGANVLAHAAVDLAEIVE